MKLFSLKVWGYKNFEDVKINFLKSERKTLVVGTNGSGKSNLLEILSAIFSACYRKEKNVTPDFRFELKYTIERMRIGSSGGTPSYSYPVMVRLRNTDGIISMEVQKEDGSWGIVDDSDFDILLPEHIIAVYSGEEKRLWEEYYFSAYDDYNKQYMDGKMAYQPQRMLYLNNYYWNLIASILAIHDIAEYREFLKNSVGLDEIYKLHCRFDVGKMRSNRNAMAKQILQVINPEQKEEIELLLHDYNSLKEVCGYESDIFYNMLVLTLYKDYKIITELTVNSSNGIEIKDLSEGEKKLLLIYGAINIIGGENLYLLDEPDAHLHEGRKREIFDLIQTVEESHFVITSHSPTLTELFDSEKVVMLSSDGGKTTVTYGDIANTISLLTNGQWNYIDHTIFLDKDRPLVLVEGEGDVKYIRKSIEVLSRNKEKYNILKNIDILHSGGAMNMNHTIDELSSCLPQEKKVIVIFDRDDEGGKGIKEIIGKGKDKADSKTYHKGQFFYFKLPKTKGYVFDTFVIEDYFTLDFKRAIAQEKLDNSAGNFNAFPKDLKKQVKDQLLKDLDTYDDITLKNFCVLLDKICSIINGTEKLTEV